VKKVQTRLILIEGLPSSGKSTTAEMVKTILDEQDIENELYLEGNLDHPADYDRVAYFNEKDYEELIENNSEKAEFIKKITDQKELGFFISYSKRLKEYQDEFSEELFKEIASNDIYELPLDLNKELILNNWKRFVKKARQADKVYIFECVFVQNPVTVSIIRDNADFSYALNYVEDVLALVKELNPVLIYLKQDNIEKSFKKVIEERPEWWLDFFIDYYTNREFGQAQDLKDLEGTLQGLKKIGQIQSDLIERLEIEKHIINNSEFNREKTKKELEDILKDYF
jgi:adenylate kinase family enzyme